MAKKDSAVQSTATKITPETVGKTYEELYYMVDSLQQQKKTLAAKLQTIASVLSI